MKWRARVPRAACGASAVLLCAVAAFAGDLNPPPGPIMPTDRVQLNEQAITLPYTISQPGSYVLTSNLTGVSGQHGIIIDADDVTLDLNGFALLGIGGSLDGVHVNGAQRNVSVFGGTIRGWGGSGVGASSATNGRFAKLALSNNGGAGLDIGLRSLLIGLTAHNNNGAGVRASGDGNRIEQCHVAGNGRGIDVDGTQNLIVKNSAVSNGSDYDIAAGNAFGPIVSVGGAGDISFVPKADHPWANFSLICPTWCQDADGDGFGDPSVTQQSCTQPGGFVADCTDCDDADPSVNPGAPEICDGQDNDCDGQVDEEGGTTWCRDSDGDGFGDPGVTQVACTQPSGFVSDCTDCNDFDPSINPAATEQCNGQDDDCDGQVDEGNPEGGGSCNTGQPGVCAAGTFECQGGTLVCEPNTSPSSETCDGLDNDCNGTIDDGTADASCDDGQFCSGVESCNNGACESSGDPCPGPDGDTDCVESCDEASDSCTANDPDGSTCLGGTCSGGVCTP